MDHQVHSNASREKADLLETWHGMAFAFSWIVATAGEVWAMTTFCKHPLRGGGKAQSSVRK
jgi:hypothetical protein